LNGARCRSSQADADIDSIFVYLTARAGRRVAADYVRSLELLYDRLADHPASSPRRPALGRDIRIGIVSPFVVIYRHGEGDDTVTVLRVVHGRRDITRKLLRRPG